MLGQLSDAADGKLTFSLGCDFHFSYDNIRDALAHPRRYTIGDSQYLLIEFSDYGHSAQREAGPVLISSSGMVPIITHPERNQILLRKPEMVLEMVEQGCLVQVTANSHHRILGQPLEEDGGMAAEARSRPRHRQRRPRSRTPQVRCFRKLAKRSQNSRAKRSRTRWSCTIPRPLWMAKSLPYQPLYRECA